MAQNEFKDFCDSRNLNLSDEESKKKYKAFKEAEKHLQLEDEGRSQTEKKPDFKPIFG